MAYRNYPPKVEDFGGVNGSVMILYGNTYAVKEDLKEMGCKYNAGLGWYAPANVFIAVPEGVSTMNIAWEDIDGKSVEEIKAYVKELTQPATAQEPSKSEYQGTVGAKLTLKVHVTRNYELNGYYGTSHMHTFEDADGNVYLWTTAAKNLEVNSNVELTGFVKAFNEYKGVKQTVLTRCKVL